MSQMKSLTLNGTKYTEFGELPSFDLAAMGLPAITLDGVPASCECDTTELMAALQKGVVELKAQVNNGSTVFDACAFALNSMAVADNICQTVIRGEAGSGFYDFQTVVTEGKVTITAIKVSGVSVPAPTDADNGKFLRVVDGTSAWQMDYTTNTDPDCHAEYFTITDDGVVSLKPEYRGKTTRTDCPDAVSDMGSGIAGSRNAELPSFLIIPEIVGDKVVSRLADGAFHTNLAVKKVVFSRLISGIPYRCFDKCNNLVGLYNTEHIKTIDRSALNSTAVSRVNFPNLEIIANTSAFLSCGHLVYADIGKVTSLPAQTFTQCTSLNRVKSDGGITSVGKLCFAVTPNMGHMNIAADMSSIGDSAFLCSGMEYDWSTLINCTFGEDATPLQYNPTDFWSACTFTPCENPLPTFLSQDDPRWASRKIGTTSIAYSSGCGIMDFMHIYCGLHNIALTSVTEFEDIVNEINPGLLNTYTQSMADQKAFMEGLGLSVESYTTYNQTVLQTLYDALADGKYATITLVGQTTTMGHTVVVYGINDSGELLVADPCARCKDALEEPTKWSLSYHKLTAPSYYNWPILHIVSL